jgi:hypothetical protein
VAVEEEAASMAVDLAVEEAEAATLAAAVSTALGSVVADMS